MRKLFKANELAEMFNLSVETIWRYGRQGKLETVRFGRTVMFKMPKGV